MKMTFGSYKPSAGDWRGGQRLVVVTQQGRKWAQLLDFGSLDRVRVPVSELRRITPEDTARPKWMVRSIRRRIGWHQPSGLDLTARKAAIKELSL
jgi:hypothetical protein